MLILESGRGSSVIAVLADESLKRNDPLLRAERVCAKKSSAMRLNTARTDIKQNDGPQLFPERVLSARYIPSAIRHAVYMRDRGLCQICGTSRAIEVDHIDPLAFGGVSASENLRLLCRSCNQRHAIETFGLEKMSNYIG